MLAWTGLLAVAVKLGLSLAALPDTGAFQFNLQGYVTLALPAFFFATTPLWMRGLPMDMGQIRNGVDAHFPPDTYNRFVHTLRPLQLLAAFAVVAGAACQFASGGTALNEHAVTDNGGAHKNGVSRLRTLRRQPQCPA